MLNNVNIKECEKIKRGKLVLMDRKEIYFSSKCCIEYIIVFYMKNVKHWMQRLKHYGARMHILSSWFCISFINLIVVRQKTVTDHYSKYVRTLPFTQQKGRYEYSSNIIQYIFYMLQIFTIVTAISMKAIFIFYGIKKKKTIICFTK